MLLLPDPPHTPILPNPTRAHSPPPPIQSSIVHVWEGSMLPVACCWGTMVLSVPQPAAAVCLIRCHRAPLYPPSVHSACLPQEAPALHFNSTEPVAATTGKGGDMRSGPLENNQKKLVGIRIERKKAPLTLKTRRSTQKQNHPSFPPCKSAFSTGPTQ